MNSESPIEAALLAALLPHGWVATAYELGPWRLTCQREVTVDGQDYRIDLAIVSPFKRIAVEADGAQWHASPDDQTRDRARDRALVLDGWTVLHFSGREIHRTPDACARDVMRAMGYAAPDLSPMLGPELPPGTVRIGDKTILYPDNSSTERFAERLRAARASIFRETHD